MSSITTHPTAEHSDERWAPVEGYDRRFVDFYEVSSHGRVRSLDRTDLTRAGHRRRYPGKVLRPIVHPEDGHLMVFLYRGGQAIPAKVHHLVAAAFIGPRPEGALVRHLDDIPANNHPANLAYGTESDNAADALRNGRHHNATKVACKRGHALAGRNLRTGERADGKIVRWCRSCDTAVHTAARRGHRGDQALIQRLADARYAELADLAVAA
jgi:hypothetical protein